MKKISKSNNLMSSSNALSAYLAGLLASMTPCVLCLIPLVLIRFLSRDKQTLLPTNTYQKNNSNNIKNIIIFILGFQCSYLIFGFLLNSLLTSFIQNGVKLGLGNLFIILSSLSLIEKIDPLQLPIFDNIFIFGISFALLLSINPCTIPFLSLIISLNPTNTLSILMIFAQGLITPSICFIFMGNFIIEKIENTFKANIMNYIKKISSIALSCSGLYLIHSIFILSFYDRLITSILFLFTTLLTISKVQKKRKFRLGLSKKFKIYLYLCIIYSIYFLINGFNSHNNVIHNAYKQSYSLDVISIQQKNNNTEENDINQQQQQKANDILAKYGIKSSISLDNDMLIADQDIISSDTIPDCIDLSLLEPCHTCNRDIKIYMIISITIFLLIFISHVKKSKKKA